MTLHERFEQFRDDFLNFEDVENRLSNRPDLHAFLLLDKIIPGDRALVSAAYNDEIYLDVTGEDLEKVGITDDQIQELVLSGIRYSTEYDSLCMFV